MPFRPMLIIYLLFLGLASSLPAHTRPINIVTDIGPVQAIVSAVVAGTQVPQQLISRNISPHDFALKPSHIRKLQQADLIVWLGPQATPGLAKLMQRPEFADKAIALNLLSTTRLHSVRNAGLATNADAKLALDPHSWLDPENGLVWANGIFTRLMDLDPENTAAYQANLDAFSKEVGATKQAIGADFLIAQPLPYTQFHDAFQYFEKAVGLSPLGFVTTGDTEAASLGILSQIRTELASHPHSCVFALPQQVGNATRVFAGIAGVKIGVIDPFGAALGTEFAYPALLKDVAAGFTDCIFNPS
jgi:zinc transport system substrate-binding protein